ncbi:hypothetical protein K438DRAFT_1978794 [Mycena galopus ATCC 62051]|nr:hypothetical protein K438DRAFT_1978794 [Mycena galopus ATCC 62051]
MVQASGAVLQYGSKYSFTSAPPFLRKMLACLAPAADSCEREHERTKDVAEAWPFLLISAGKASLLATLTCNPHRLCTFNSSGGCSSDGVGPSAAGSDIRACVWLPTPSLKTSSVVSMTYGALLGPSPTLPQAQHRGPGREDWGWQGKEFKSIKIQS